MKYVIIEDNVDQCDDNDENANGSGGNDDDENVTLYQFGKVLCAV